MNKNKIISTIIILIVAALNIFMFGWARVDGNSMNPTLKNNNILLFSKINKNYNRFDIIILNIDGKKYIKRIIGMPGETIEYIDNKLLVNSQHISEPFEIPRTKNFTINDISPYNSIPDDMYLVLGDNRVDSYDSRSFGLVSNKDIDGKIIFKLL